MKTISKIRTVLFFILIVGFISCEGPMGPAGKDGTNGVDGQDGNANVISSGWITPDWSATNSTLGEFYYDDDAITESFMNSGVLFSYADWYGDGSQIHLLPLSYVYSGNTINYNVTMKVGKIRWWFISPVDYTPPSTIKFRYVIIPVSTASKSANPQQEILYNLDRASVDVNNYYQVMDYYGLEY